MKNNKKVYAHLCTWFSTPEYSFKYQMWNSDYLENPHNPNTILFNGLPDAACIGIPLIGLYDSADDKLIEYQFKLMKYIGIDGVIVDWDGRRINKARHRKFLKILDHLESNQLELIVCFEEWCGYYPKNTYLNRQQEIDAAFEELKWLNKNVLQKKYYASIDQKKPILVFRKIPDQWFNAEEWMKLKEMTSLFNINYYFNDCYDESFVKVVDGYFFWIGDFDNRNVNTISFLKQKYFAFRKCCLKNKKPFIMSVVPGFDDSMVWGWGGGARIAPRYNGKRYEVMWNWAIENNDELVQIVTWNDWNEGSQIEPSTIYGYKYLEITRNKIDTFKNRESKDHKYSEDYYKKLTNDYNSESRKI